MPEPFSRERLEELLALAKGRLNPGSTLADLSAGVFSAKLVGHFHGYVKAWRAGSKRARRKADALHNAARCLFAMLTAFDADDADPNLAAAVQAAVLGDEVLLEDFWTLCDLVARLAAQAEALAADPDHFYNRPDGMFSNPPHLDGVEASRRAGRSTAHEVALELGYHLGRHLDVRLLANGCPDTDGSRSGPRGPAITLAAAIMDELGFTIPASTIAGIWRSAPPASERVTVADLLC